MLPKLDIIARLGHVPLFAGLDESVLQQLADGSRRRCFPPRDTLFHEGDPGHTLYLVLAGHVRIQTLTASGDLLPLTLCGPGEHFGELALLTDRPRTADAVTVDTCDLLMLDRSVFLACLEQHPHLALAVIAYLADRLMAADEQRKRRQELDVLGRVSAVLLEWAAAVGEEPDNGGGGQRLPAGLTQQQMAEEVGATRFSVNRALARLKSVEAIRSEGRQLVILNETKLRQYSSV